MNYLATARNTLSRLEREEEVTAIALEVSLKIVIELANVSGIKLLPPAITVEDNGINFYWSAGSLKYVISVYDDGDIFCHFSGLADLDPLAFSKESYDDVAEILTHQYSILFNYVTETNPNWDKMIATHHKSSPDAVWM